MGQLGTTTFEQQRERANKQRARQIEKDRAKRADPAWQQAQREKQLAAAQRYRENQIAKRKEAQAQPKPAKATSSKPAAPKKTKPATSKGMLGRTPTAFEKRVMNQIGKLSCECCNRVGRDMPVISLHHVNGRTAPLAHVEVLPVCCWHHDTPADKEALTKYPDLIPTHAKGSHGGKAAWTKQFGTAEDMLVVIWQRLGLVELIAAELAKQDQKTRENWHERYPKIDLFELPNQ